MNEKTRMNEGLQLAIKFEKEGREFFLKAAQATGHPLGKRLFQSLANDELVHLRRVTELFAALQNKQDWPKTQGHEPKTFHTIFEEAKEHLKEIVQPQVGEIEALNLGLELEERGYKFYKNLAEESVSTPEREFYQELAAAEDNHYQTIQSTIKYLENPADWYADQEHQIYEGG